MGVNGSLVGVAVDGLLAGVANSDMFVLSLNKRANESLCVLAKARHTLSLASTTSLSLASTTSFPFALPLWWPSYHL